MRETKGGKPYRPRGTGSLFQRGETWWIKLHVNGRPQYQSTGTTSQKDAEKFLKRQLLKAEQGVLAPPKVERVTISDLVKDLLQWYRTDAKRGIHANRSEARWTQHLEPVFGHVRANSLGTDAMRAYRAKRVAEGASDTTVNRELQIMRKAYPLCVAENLPSCGCQSRPGRNHPPRCPENLSEGEAGCGCAGICGNGYSGLEVPSNVQALRNRGQLRPPGRSEPSRAVRATVAVW